jgi:DNA repair photolyase
MQCKSIINRSRISGIDYTINPYTGCQHGCVYCYARFMARYTAHQMAWGSFCDVKTNALDILRKQIRKLPRGLVSLSTVTDPYQSVEEKCRITRAILAELAAHRFPVSVLTKSDLVLRDMDVLRSFKSEECEVGFSIAALDEKVRRTFEPQAPPVQRRIEALQKLHEAGIRTWMFIAPTLPFPGAESVVALLDAVRGHVDSVLVDTLNIKCGNWSGIIKALHAYNDALLPEWKAILFSKEKRLGFYQSIWRIIGTYCREYRINVRFCDI